MSPLFRSTADVFAELNRMQSMLDRVFPSPGASIRSQAGAGFPVLTVGTSPTSIRNRYSRAVAENRASNPGGAASTLSATTSGPSRPLTASRIAVSSRPDDVTNDAICPRACRCACR